MNIKKDLNINADQLAKLGIRFDGSYRTGKERFLTFYPIEKKKEYSIVDIPKGIRLCSDVTNDTMTLENTDIQNDSSSVTSEISNIYEPQVSQVSLPSQVSQGEPEELKPKRSMSCRTKRTVRSKSKLKSLFSRGRTRWICISASEKCSHSLRLAVNNFFSSL